MTKEGFERFGVLTAMTTKITIFWHMKLSYVTEIYRRLGETCCFYPEEGRIYGDILHFGQVVLIRPYNYTLRV
jgi:hypothetical protein